jgi:predicted nucleotidyltransferase
MIIVIRLWDEFVSFVNVFFPSKLAKICEHRKMTGGYPANGRGHRGGKFAVKKGRPEAGYMPSYQSYKRSWKKRNQEEAEHNRHRSDQAHKDGCKIAEYLGKKYRVSRVFLFGSVTKDGAFNGNSDLDIAVVGLDKSDFYKALADISQLTEFNIDLKPLEDCSEIFRQRVEEQGEVVYER